MADGEYGKIGEEGSCEIENLVVPPHPSASSSATHITTTKLMAVHGLLHCREYNDGNLSNATAELKSFGASNVPALCAIFEKAHNKNAIPTTRGSIAFNNFVEN